MSGKRLRSSVYAEAVTVQAEAGTRATIDTNADVAPIANPRPGNEVFTVRNPEGTGSIHAVGDAVIGRAHQMTRDFLLAGPGGTAPPDADTYVLGRWLRTAAFEEIVSQTPLIPSEALGSGSTTTTVVLGASASSDDDAYIGYPLMLGTPSVANLTSIIAYDGATKTATISKTLDAVPTGNYSIPAFLGYRLLRDFDQKYLTCHCFMDGKVYPSQDVFASAVTFNVPVANRGDNAIPTASIGSTGDIDDVNAPEFNAPVPAVAVTAAPPVFRAGDAYFSGLPVDGSAFTVNMGLETSFPSDPNGVNGNGPGCATQTRRVVNMVLNETLTNERDLTEIARVQQNHSLYLRWGERSGRITMITVPEGRLSHSSPDGGQSFLTRSPDLIIDKTQDAIVIMHPYF